MDSDSIPTLSFKALQRARTTLEDFALSYFPLHGLPPTAFFKHSDVLTFVEGLIYQMDEDNEALCGRGVAGDAALQGEIRRQANM